MRAWIIGRPTASYAGLTRVSKLHPARMDSRIKSGYDARRVGRLRVVRLVLVSDFARRDKHAVVAQHAAARGERGLPLHLERRSNIQPHASAITCGGAHGR